MPEMGKAEQLVMPSGTVMAKWTNTKPSARFNSKSFQAANPEEYAKWVDIIPGTRRFSLK